MNKLVRYEVKVLLEKHWIILTPFPPTDQGYKDAKDLFNMLTDRIEKKIEFVYKN